MRSILFVCLGNICRSPIADGIANALAREYDLELFIDSAALGPWHVGNPPCENSIKVAAKYGIDVAGLRAREVTDEDRSFDLIVAMDENNLRELEARGFKNVIKLGRYAGYENACVPDPYFFNGFAGFEKVWEMIDTCVRDMFEKENLLC